VSDFEVEPPALAHATHHRFDGIEFWTAPNAIGPILVDGREIVRRLFVTVRDSVWREIEPREDRLDVDGAETGQVRIGALH
jgi:hypothetical protein